jgi:radical SAM protein with 4Fe4S-binding SPASM domain
MPDVARSMGFKSICIVPYYYVPESQGLEYEGIMAGEFRCKGYSWRGFHHEDSGVDPKAFLAQLDEYNLRLGDVYSYPYLPLTAEQYTEWYTRSDTTVKQMECNNIHGLLDVQPDGSVNFCVDFPDYAIGNIHESTLAGLWNSPEAKRFREYREARQLPVCYRCGAKYMA